MVSQEKITPTETEIQIASMILSGEYKRMLVVGIGEDGKEFVFNLTDIDSDALGLLEVGTTHFVRKQCREDDLESDWESN